MSEALTSGVLVTLIMGAFTFAVTRRLDRIEDKVDRHTDWHMNTCPVWRGKEDCR